MVTHGLSRGNNGKHTPTYTVWSNMKKRCNKAKPGSRAYFDYYLRGIRVCERWLNFENFHNDMGPKPEGMTLERVDNDKGYSPDNCRWATYKEQSQNRRKRKMWGTGVTQLKDTKKWQASVTTSNRSSKSLGCYDTFEEARLVRLSYEIKTEVIESGLFAFLTRGAV